MKAKILYSDKFLDSVGIFFRIGGITLFPFIILREKYRDGSDWWKAKAKKIINHEEIHIKQQAEMLIIPFYILYAFFYLWNIFKYKFNIKKAYYQIPFEQEAFNNESDYNYLTNRKLYSWVKHIF